MTPFTALFQYRRSFANPESGVIGGVTVYLLIIWTLNCQDECHTMYTFTYEGVDRKAVFIQCNGETDIEQVNEIQVSLFWQIKTANYKLLNIKSK